jgi:hypothetical protein
VGTLDDWDVGYAGVAIIDLEEPGAAFLVGRVLPSDRVYDVAAQGSGFVVQSTSGTLALSIDDDGQPTTELLDVSSGPPVNWTINVSGDRVIGSSGYRWYGGGHTMTGGVGVTSYVLEGCIE